MPKPRLFVEVGQRIGDGVVLDPEVRLPRRYDPRRTERHARLLCDCGNQYVASMAALIGSRPDTMSCGCRRMISRGVIDLTGQRFGRLVVVKIRGYKPTRWICRCDCGKEATISAACLVGGYTKSCGCLGRGFKLGPHGAARNSVLRGYKYGARTRGLPWDLSEEDFDRLTSLACFYCGTPPSRTATYGTSTFTYSGIDRMDNDLGYTQENAVACCWLCNHAKMDLPYEEWMAWVGRLAAHSWFSPERMSSRLIKDSISAVKPPKRAALGGAKRGGVSCPPSGLRLETSRSQT